MLTLALIMAIGLHDGDTLKLDKEYRLYGIDAPELTQACTKAGKQYPCGQESRTHLYELLKGKELKCIETGEKSYNRSIATCYADGQDLSEQMVRDGQAISYKHFTHKYDAQELEAKQAKRGIWAGTFQEPYKYRKSHD